MAAPRVIGAVACVLLAAIVLWTAGLPDRRFNTLILQSANVTPVAPEEGALAPAFEGIDVAGKWLSLETLRGSPVVVNFWATTCGPCFAEMPMLQAVYTAQRANGLHVIGIDANEPLPAVLAWQAYYGLDYDLLIDPDASLSRAYRIRGLPTTFFVGRDGVISWVVYGPLSRADLDSEIQRLLRKVS
ncbi:MAG TPA: TlpA disulfide reductase family protein [Aggregatilineales bacterium]|nr:TlpA disulfide reductase family protein [Aggregatilineales bacterium]